MKNILMFILSVLTSFSIINVKAENREYKEGFYFNDEPVEVIFYEYGTGIPLYDVNGYSITARVYLDKWYNLGSTKTWNSVSSYNGKYEITINFAALEPNKLYELYVGVSTNKGTFTKAKFDFYNILNELDTSVGSSTIEKISDTYFIWSEKVESINTLTKVVLTLDMTTGTGSHTTEVAGVNMYEYEPEEPPTSGDSSILDWLNDTWANVIIGLSNQINQIWSGLKNIISPQIETIIGILENGLGITNEEDTSTNDNANEQLGSAVNQYDSIEQGIVQDFNSNINNLNTDLNILGVTDFVKTSTFISTNLQNIYNSSDYIKFGVMFSLIIGIAMTIIGIKTRR